MSNGSGQNPETPPDTTAAADEAAKPRGASLRSLQAVARLRERVEAAVRELERLRQENAALAERIRQLEANPAADFEGTLLTFDEDPDAVREQVERFIATLDRYLDKAENG